MFSEGTSRIFLEGSFGALPERSSAKLLQGTAGGFPEGSSGGFLQGTSEEFPEGILGVNVVRSWRNSKDDKERAQ